MSRIAQFLTRRPAIPEITADEKRLFLFYHKVQYGTGRGISRAGGFSVSKTVLYRALVDRAACIDVCFRSGPTDFETMTTRAGLVLVDREFLIQEDGLS